MGFVGCVLVGGLVLTKLSVNKKKDHKNKSQYISLKDNENVSIWYFINIILFIIALTVNIKYKSEEKK